MHPVDERDAIVSELLLDPCKDGRPGRERVRVTLEVDVCDPPILTVVVLLAVLVLLDVVD